MTETPEPEVVEESIIVNINKDLDDLDFEKLKPILKAVIENVGLLNYMVAIMAENIGIDFTDDPNTPSPDANRDSGGYI